jgi:hypothetical protein
MCCCLPERVQVKGVVIADSTKLKIGSSRTNFNPKGRHGVAKKLNVNSEDGNGRK